MSINIRRLTTRDQRFADMFAAFVAAKRAAAEDVSGVVAKILADVRRRGDGALVDYTRKFDGLALTRETMRVTPREIDDAVAACDPATLDALRLAATRIRAFHERQRPQDDRFVDAAGVELGSRWTPLATVGVYVPGGTAAYPSSVLMNAIPAQVAGVARVVMTVPSPKGQLNPLVLAAAREAGVHEIYKIGGAQAIGALAYGTVSIAPVDKIMGPGNAYVAEAKRQVFGIVGIDMIAGPSEILVVADGKNDPAWIAADLLSQAEHDTAAQSILITNDSAFATRVGQAIDTELATLGRAATARMSLEAHGAMIIVDDWGQVPALVDALAPEHLELAIDEPEALAAQVRNAGAIFLGRMTPEAIGDYVAGTNHVLPTARSARFSSGLSVYDFMKRTSIVKCDAASLAAIGGAAATLAEAEGLGAHARSVTIRTNRI